MSCQKPSCDCATFVPSKFITRQFVGRCVTCSHGHTDEQDVAHVQANQSDSVPCVVGEHRVFISNIVAASNAKLLREHGITHIVCCCPGAFSFASTAGKPLDQDQGFTRLDLAGFEDSGNQALSAHTDAAFRFIEAALDASPEARVLVHCAQGVSRSTSVVVDWLMRKHAMSYDDALQLCKRTRPIVQPNTSFERQLRKLDAELRKPQE